MKDNCHKLASSLTNHSSLLGGHPMKVITEEEFARATKLDKLSIPGFARLVMEIMKINDINEEFAKACHLEGIAFINKILESIGVSIDFQQEELENLPKEGAFIAVANHPYGGIEGLALLFILLSVRKDAKLMANFLLQKIRNLREFFVGVNPFENINHPSSISGIKNTLMLLQNGAPIGIFPAGEVSTYQLGQFRVTDKVWHPVVGKIIAKAMVPVIPIYFHGNNGLVFNLLSLIHPTLRTAKLPSEFMNKQGHKLRVRIGRPIFMQETPFLHDSNKLLNYLRARTYALGTSLKHEKKVLLSKSLFKVKQAPQPIALSFGTQLLTAEVNKLKTQYSVLEEKNYEVFIAPAFEIPHIIEEIGRLRELTFREVGEGSNKALDLDEYDIYYRHLFIWDWENKCIVGAYRIGNGDEIYSAMGGRGFYIASLFKIQGKFFQLLQHSLELGRSWVRKEYQQKPLPLYLLWRGILKYLMDKPRYRYLVGPVSISNTFSKLSKSLIVDYITAHHFDHELAQYVKPRKKFRVDFSKINKDLLLESHSSLKDLDSLISEIEISHMKIPVLLRQYIALNAKIICFNIDPKFSDSLDGFLVVDLQKIPQEIIEKMGKNI